MPRRNKKTKITSDQKKDEHEIESSKSPQEEGKEGKVEREKPEKKGLLLSLDKKLKLQMKRQKKKERKREFEAGNKKIPGEVKTAAVVEWESAAELGEAEEAEEGRGTVVEDAVRVSRAEVVDDSLDHPDTPEMTEEEEKSLREFLRTLEIVDNATAKQQADKCGIDSEVVKNKFYIETIPEDLFEEFIENEEMAQTKEAIRTFPRTSPKHSPNLRRKEAFGAEPPKAVVVSPPPRVFYSYCGASFAEPREESGSDRGLEEDPLATRLLAEPELYPRRLDVILEESSDFSDASGQSEMKRKRKSEEEGAEDRHLFSFRPAAVETFPSDRKDGAVGGDSRGVRPAVVKIELAETESEGEFEINQSETSKAAGRVEIVYLEDDSSECATSEDQNLRMEGEARGEKCVRAVGSGSDDSARPLEEGSESWRSSLNPESCDGAEADVESELESQRTILGHRPSVRLSDLFENDEGGVEIFITNFKEAAAKDPDRDSWNSLNGLSLYEVDGEGLFRRKFFAATRKNEPADSVSRSEEAPPPSEVDLSLASKNGDAVHTDVNVKHIAERIKDDLDRILMSKMKVMKSQEEPRLSEASWAGFLEGGKALPERKAPKSAEASPKPPRKSGSSSYENVAKSEKVIRVVRTVPEVSRNPEALSNLAEKKVLTLPYGRLVLKKIGLGSCCSKDSESNKDPEEEMYVKTSPRSKGASELSSLSSDVFLYVAEDEKEEEEDRNYIEFDYSNPKIGETEKWYGMRTAVPAVLVGLSPSQKKVYEEKRRRRLPDEAEAASLLDLHRKFLERRSYHEGNPWSREKNLVFDSDVSITNVTTANGSSTQTIQSRIENKDDADKAKEKRIAKEHMRSSRRVGSLPRKGTTGSVAVGNEKPENEDGLLKSKCYDEKDREKEHNDSKADRREGEESTRTHEDSRAVGKSRLLALLQNAISDEFVPELNTDASIKSSRESHEVSVAENRETVMDNWQRERKLGHGSKEEGATFGSDVKTFRDFWSKEKKYCSLQEARPRLGFRPKTICCENETELYGDGTRTARPPAQSTGEGKGRKEEEEELVVTENLPAVSEVIRSFEEPKVRTRVEENRANRKTEIRIDNERYQISKKGDVALIRNDSEERRRRMQKEKRRSMPASILSEREIFKQKMYDEYMSKLAERIERRQQKVIRVSRSNEIECPEEGKFLDIENEFISKVRERREKMGAAGEALESPERRCQEFADYWAGETFGLENGRTAFGEREDSERAREGGGTESTGSKRSSVQLVLDTTSDVESLPKHLKELLQVEGEEFPDFLQGIWSPAQRASEEKTEIREENEERKKVENEPIPPVWTPRSAQASPILEKKEFRPVTFESPTLPRKKYIQDDKKESSVPPPWQQPGGDKPPELAKSSSSPALSLPRAPNPTVTLLQKAREGHLPRGAHYLNSDMNESPASDGTTIERLEIVSSVKNESDRPRKIEIAPKKVIGIGPTTKEGIPLVLRSEVSGEENREKWYKRMYDSLHKYGKDDDFVTVKYRTSPRRQGLYNYQHGSSSGYQSEPESLSYDLSTNKYVTLDRRRNEKVKENESASVTLPRSRASPPRRDFVGYKNQPGRIEDYEPGHSSISELESNKWWDEVLEIFDRWLGRNPEAHHPACNKLLIDVIRSRREEEKSRPVRKSQSPRSYANYASAYISDPQYVYRRSEDELQSPPSSEEQKEAYRIIQKGGEIPLKGLRKPAPERPKEGLDPEIEYFPLSPTLTRIRVHKQNITPLSEFPFYANPFATLNYPRLPFGVCSSFSQVQFFPPPLPLASGGTAPEAGRALDRGVSHPPEREQKFSVQLQNISGPDDYVRIVPKPRSQPKKTPIYANLPVREGSCSPGRKKASVSPREDPPKRTTFSDLKRVAASVNSTAISKASSIPVKQPKVSGEKPATKKKESSISKLAAKSSAGSKKSGAGNKENFLEKKPLCEKGAKKERKKALADTAGSIARKAAKGKVPLSESLQREKPLSKTNRRLKALSENLKKKKADKKREEKEEDAEDDIIEYLSRFVEYESETSYVDLKATEEIKPQVSSEESEEETAMSSIYESPEESRTAKPKVDSDMTEVFRSRSFSPDVKRKIFKLPDMNKPVPPKRKQSKISPTLKMWSRMMVSYPHRRSRLESFDSNVKFLGDKIKRKLADEKESKIEFGDDVETVRTVDKDKNGDVSIKTNRYVRLSRPASSGSASARATYPDIERRRLLSEPRTRFGSADSLRRPKYGDSPATAKAADPEGKKSTKGLDAFVKSSTTYSLRGDSVAEEEDKRKSVKVTVAISSKGKELLRKTAGVTSPLRKTVSKSSSSPCPSLSSKSGASEKGSTTSSHDRTRSPQRRFLSPHSSTSRLSSPSRSISSGSAIAKQRMPKVAAVKKPSAPPAVIRAEAKRTTTATTTTKAKEIGKTCTSTVTKYSGRRLLSQIEKGATKSPKKTEKPETTGNGGKFRQSGNGRAKAAIQKKGTDVPEKERNEVIEGRDLVRTDSFFQNLFLRSPPERRSLLEPERTSSVSERALRYQRRINWPDVYKSEPSLSLVTYYLNQKRPVSSSRFRSWDRERSPSGSRSPSGGLLSEAFRTKLKRFDLMSQFGEELFEEFSLEAKERSSSEPPLRRSPATSPDRKPEAKSSRASLSEASSMRSSPTSSRSPSCRRIQNLRSSTRTSECGREARRFAPRARSAGEAEELKSKSDLGKSWSSLNLSNLGDHAEYQAYVLELVHSRRKCERFRELHKFYSNLERMGRLEKTASAGDLRPRLRNEEIIDFDRWKKIRTKERAEAELKTLVDDLVKVQKEKDLLFRAADVEAVRWKGDRGLRIKERSVEDLKEQFDGNPEENPEGDAWRREAESRKDHYKPLWRGNSIVDVATNLNNALVSHRGRPVTLEEFGRIEKSNARIGKEYGFSLKAWSSLSDDQVNALKDQLSEIYAADARRRCFEGNAEEFSESYEVLVPGRPRVRSPGESCLRVRCSSALSKSQTYTPTVRRKEELRREWRRAESVSVLPSWQSDDGGKAALPRPPWSEEKPARSHSEGRSAARDRRPESRSKSASRPLSENEKKRLSMTLSREVIEKMSKASAKGPLFPRETLGALAAAGSKLRDKEEKGIEESTTVEKESSGKGGPPREQESGSGSSETSVKTVIRKNSMDVLKKVQYFEELQQRGDALYDSEFKDEARDSDAAPVECRRTTAESEMRSRVEVADSRTPGRNERRKNVLVTSSSLENLGDYFGQQRQYATSTFQSKSVARTATGDASRKPVPTRGEEPGDLRSVSEEKKWAVERYRSLSPGGFRSAPAGSSNESLFSYRSRSVSPDPTKYYRAYLRMVKCGAVRKLCNKFESWEDLLSLSSDRDFWSPPPRRFASDPELTRDLLRRFGTDPAKVTVRGQEVGDVRWLRTKFEKESWPPRGRSRFRRVRSPLARSPLTVADRFMPRINVISKTAELQMQRLESERAKGREAGSGVGRPAASPEGHPSLIDHAKDRGGYYYTGEVEKLRRKFERLQEAERLSILGQMYTSAPDVNELRDIAPYLECSWVAHRHPGVTKTFSTPELESAQEETRKKTPPKPRPRSSSPARPKRPSSILKPDRNVFADQKFDPSIHRPKYRYQPEREVDRRYKRGDPDWWRHWTKPTVTFKETVSFKSEPEIRDLSPDSPRKYVESEVTIHYKSPVRSEAKAMLSEDELARRQAESMKRIYKEERRRKYLQELQDMNSRRHTDNFTPSQKSPISLNRYDDFPLDPTAFYARGRDYSSDPILVARGLYDFVGRRPRELGFRRGDVIFIIRKLDKNWCEGELNGVVGLFPLSYVEVLPYNEINLKYGRARAKYDFVPQTSLELSARKGDMIVILRKIDENWFEGRIGERTGIIPASYCHVLAAPQAGRMPMRAEKASKPVAAPAAHSLVHNGSGLSSKHYYTPYLSPASPGRSTTSSASVTLHDGHASADALIDEALMQLDEEFDLKRSTRSTSQPLNVRVNPRPEPALYQVLFNHVPNNDDELELIQGETVTVVEKCGDGWYIGSKTSDGKLGIFPGTHVRRVAPEFV